MSRNTQALERALSAWSACGDGDIGDFLGQAATELLHAVAPGFAALAIVTRGVEGVGVVARPRGVSALPDETLRGFLSEAVSSGGACKVRDHALDTVRFIDSHFRTSIVVVGALPASLGVGTEMVVWGGLVAGVTPKSIAEIRALTEELSRWLHSGGSTLLVVRELRRQAREARARISEMTSVAHDVRAPLAALTYLLSDFAAANLTAAEDTRKIQVELSYIDGLMETFSPSVRGYAGSNRPLCDLVEVLRRVGGRFTRQAQEAGMSFVWDVPYGDTSVAVEPLSLERVFTNVVGNSIKHSGASEVRFQVLETASAVTARIVDSGVGIPRSVLDRMRLADTSSNGALDSIRATAGWGVGLLSTKTLVERNGGSFGVVSAEGETCIEIEFPRAKNAQGRHDRKDSGVVTLRTPSSHDPALIVLVDDDVEHSASLARLLQRNGLMSKSFSSVDSALTAIRAEPGVRIVCDARMPDGGAERILRELRDARGEFSVAVMSGDADDESLYRFAALGATEFFAKPLDAERLITWALSDLSPRAEALGQ